MKAFDVWLNKEMQCEYSVIFATSCFFFKYAHWISGVEGFRHFSLSAKEVTCAQSRSD